MSQKKETNRKFLELLEGLEKELDNRQWRKMRENIVEYVVNHLFKVQDRNNVSLFFTFLAKRRKGSRLTDEVIYKKVFNKEYDKANDDQRLRDLLIEKQ